MLFQIYFLHWQQIEAQCLMLCVSKAFSETDLAIELLDICKANVFHWTSGSEIGNISSFTQQLVLSVQWLMTIPPLHFPQKWSNNTICLRFSPTVSIFSGQILHSIHSHGTDLLAEVYWLQRLQFLYLFQYLIHINYQE